MAVAPTPSAGHSAIHEASATPELAPPVGGAEKSSPPLTDPTSTIHIVPLVRPPLQIPPFSNSGVLPSYVGSVTHSIGHSPYRVTLSEVVRRFSTTAERKKIIQNLLKYRVALHQLGLVNGFQWLDGSFVEDIERLENRPPKDIDVVNFISAPIPTFNRTDIDPLVSPGSKINYQVDGQFVNLSLSAQHTVRSTSFWYGLFSHRRNGLWKGIVEVSLSPSEDTPALSILGALP